MQVDRKIALWGGWVAGPAFGVAMMAAPPYLNFKPELSAVLFWLAITVFVTTVVVVGPLSLIKQEGARVNFWPVVLMVVGVVCLGAGAAWQFWPAAKSKAPFDASPAAVSSDFKIAAAQTPQLGKPTSGTLVSSDTYFARYDHAMVIWIEPLLTIYALPVDMPPERKVLVSRDPERFTEPKWINDDFLRTQFRVPRDRSPPNGGVAIHWKANPILWSWIGWRQWECSYNPDLTYYQRFENGILIGILNRNVPQTSGQVFAVLNDGSWATSASQSQAPECKPPLPF